MKAIEISQFGAPDVLRPAVRPDPVAGEGEVLIRVAASGVNRPDVLQRTGNYPLPPGTSDIPGLELAGEIIGGDAQAMAQAGFKVGDHVCALVTGGAYAELCVAPVGQCLPVPKGWSDLEAASLPETYFTVWSNMYGRAGLQPGETVLIQGGSGGMGVTAIQLAKAFGSTVLVTAGTDDKCAACVRMGAELAINYRTHDFVQEVQRYTEGRGVDVILDMVAGPYVPRELNCLADDGRLIIIALQGGARAEVNLSALMFRRLTLSGSTLRPRTVAFKTAVAQALREKVWPLLESRQIQPVIHEVFDADQAAQAHALMESSRHVGKIMLRWS